MTATTTSDTSLDDLIMRVEAAEQGHTQALAALRDTEEAITGGEPISRTDHQNMQADVDHAAMILTGATNALDEALLNTPAADALVIHDPDAEAEREAAHDRYAEALANLDTEEKAVTRARAALDRAATKRDAAKGLAQRAKAAGTTDVELAEAFGELITRTGLAAGPVVVSHRALPAPEVHQAPTVHVIQGAPTEHGTTQFGAGQQSTSYDGRARGNLGAMLYTRPGFEAPTADEVIRAVRSAGWRVSEHLVQVVGEVDESRPTRHTLILNVDHGHVLAPPLDEEARAATGRTSINGRGNRASRLDTPISETTDEATGTTTVTTGYRLVRVVPADPRSAGRQADPRDVEEAKAILPAAAASLVGQFEPGVGHVTAARMVRNPSWAMSTRAPQLAAGQVAAGEVFVEVTGQHRKA